MAAAAGADDSLLFFVGSCAFGGPEARAIQPVRLSRDGQLALAGPTIAVPDENPGWLEWRPPSKFLYCAYEKAPGTAQALSIDGTTATPHGPVRSTCGRCPCHASLDSTGRWLLVANYVEGSVAVLPVLEDGTLGLATDSKACQGSDLIPKELHDRQESAHCHQIVPHPSNRWVVVADLGLSAVFVYGFDAARGTLSGAADDPRHLRLAANVGCRHVAWNVAGNVLYVNNELDPSVTVCSFDESSGALREIQTIPTLPDGVRPLRDHHRGNSEIHLHPNGKFLYAGCRSPDPSLITIFAIDSATHRLTLVGHESSRGLIARNFKLFDAASDGTWLVVGNQETRNIVCFAADGASGKLTFVSELTDMQLKPCNISRSSPISLGL